MSRTEVHLMPSRRTRDVPNLDDMAGLPLLMTHREVYVDLLRLDEGTGYAMNSAGNGPPRIKVGRQVRYPRAGVVAWLRDRAIAE
jgi:predicted DNA-binding transcriptional regulator AlpA